MNNKPLLFTTLALALICRCAPALANDQPAGHTPSPGLHEVPDPELASMRGRYTVGTNTVAWFGVQMISTWQGSNGQLLHSAMTFGMDFRHNPSQPQVSFVPTVTITGTHAPLPPTVAIASAGPSRSANNSGLANVTGMTQGVQIAGDNNIASNVTSLRVQDGSSTPSVIDGGSAEQTRTITVGDATATSSYDGHTAQVLLSIAGQGAVQQWIRQGSLGQSVMLTTDNQSVSNQMEITLVRQALAANTQLAQNVAQSLNLVRGIGH